MKFPFFASFIVFIIWLKYELSKTDRKKISNTNDFWNREAAANNVRKKSLDGLHYLTIPYDLIPEQKLSSDEAIRKDLEILHSLKDQKIVNLSGITNTELKMTYGTANITVLSEYDQNYIDMITSLYRIAQYLYDNDSVSEAVRLLEFGILTNTDVSGYYRTLYDYYKETHNFDKLIWLQNKAESLDSIMKESIIQYLSQDDHTDLESDL